MLHILCGEGWLGQEMKPTQKQQYNIQNCAPCYVGPCKQHGMEGLGDSLQIWRTAVNISHKQSWAPDKR